MFCSFGVSDHSPPPASSASSKVIGSYRADDPGGVGSAVHRAAQISRALRCEYPDQPARQLSTEAIYQAIYRSGSEIRRPQRATLLRSGRRYRRRRLAAGHRPRRLVSMVSIDERPDIADRRVAGHWEGGIVRREMSHAVSGDTDWRLDLMRV